MTPGMVRCIVLGFVFWDTTDGHEIAGAGVIGIPGKQTQSLAYLAPIWIMISNTYKYKNFKMNQVLGLTYTCLDVQQSCLSNNRSDDGLTRVVCF